MITSTCGFKMSFKAYCRTEIDVSNTLKGAS